MKRLWMLASARSWRPILAAASLTLVLGAGRAWAQPAGMPDPRMIAGKPLPSAEMPAGTVSVRVARQTFTNPAAGVDVTATVTDPRGDTRARVEKTDAAGRATFQGLVPGSRFEAKVEVDGETLKTDVFTLPAQGGIRSMLVAGLGAAPPEPASAGASGEGGAGAGGEEFGLGVAVAAGVPDPSLPAGTVVVVARDEAGQLVAGQEVLLGIARPEGLDVRKAVTNAEGTARFDGIAAGENTGAAAVLERNGMRIGTEPFAMPADRGVRAEIRSALATSDPSVLHVAEGSKIALTLREGALEVIELLRIENKSERIFKPGPAGIEVPLPFGFVNAQGFEGDSSIVERKDLGIAVTAGVPPGGIEARFAFILPYLRRSARFEQRMPYGMASPSVIMETRPGLAIAGAGVTTRTTEHNGRSVIVASFPSVPAGGTLSFTVSGLPGPDVTYRAVAGAAALLLVIGAVIFGRRPAAERARLSATGARLRDEREALFTQLVALERDGAPDPDQRRDLVGKLEGNYREAAKL